MGHERTVQREFTRQAQAFARSETLRSSQITERIGDVLDTGTGRVLDLACGPGVLAGALAPRAQQVVALDLTQGTLRLARERCRDSGLANLCFAQGVAESTPFPDRCFDAVVLRLALHHFEDPRRVLRECRRLLRGAGQLVVLDILTSDDAETAVLHNAIERLRDPSHTAMLAAGELRSAVEGSGFRVEAEARWQMPRCFPEWAAIISEPARMSSLEIVLRRLAQAGQDAGIALREEADELWFTYDWCLLVARPDDAPD